MAMNGVGERAPVASRWKVHLRGHLLLFEPRPWPRYSQATGLRLLAVATGLEALRLALVRGLSPLVPLWVLMPLLLGAALVLVPRVAGLALSDLGLRRWREWSTTEKSYFLQVMLLASGVLLIGVAVPMFASIFLIGLFFGVLYRRSGNLWIVGCFHAIGNAAIVWRVGSLQ
jgi:membrane protease YdiL (CAAX protease family)